MPVTSASQTPEQPWRSETFDRLMATAQVRPEAAALRHKNRGAWTAWTWASIVDEVDRFAASLQRLGVGAGDRVALSGEISPNLLLLGLAARVAGASVVALPLRPLPVATSRRLPYRVVVVQRRDALLPWIEAAEQSGAGTTILFDHATPDGTRPLRDVLTVASAREIAAPRGWANTLGRPARAAHPAPSTWIEETTDWAEVFDVTLDAWLATGGALVCPELLAAATRDRRDIQPDRWIVSRDRLAAAAAEIDARLPAAATPSGRIVRSSRPTSRGSRPADRQVAAAPPPRPLRPCRHRHRADPR